MSKSTIAFSAVSERPSAVAWKTVFRTQRLILIGWCLAASVRVPARFVRQQQRLPWEREAPYRLAAAARSQTYTTMWDDWPVLPKYVYVWQYIHSIVCIYKRARMWSSRRFCVCGSSEIYMLRWNTADNSNVSGAAAGGAAVSRRARCGAAEGRARRRVSEPQQRPRRFHGV